MSITPKSIDQPTNGGHRKSRFGDLFSSSRTWRGIFFLTILFRTYFSITNSYIHPDEHFQGPEAIADKIFGWSTKKSWEFTSNSPIRSYIPLYIIYGLPMAFIKSVLFKDDNYHTIDPLTIYYALRIVFSLGSWVLCDMAIDRLSNAKQDRIKGLLFVGSSYVTWTYQSHTFSNSVETVVLLWCLVIIHEFKNSRYTAVGRHFDSGLLGILIIFGIFNRITFPAFLAIPSFWLIEHFRKFPLTFITFGASCLIAAMSFISIDTKFYANTGEHYVIAPLNSILYNVNSDNLSNHGIHPRYNHLIANLPQLLGPGLIFLFSSKKYLKSLPFLSAISGILILSIIPHQEARFLTPAIPLLCWCFNTSKFPPKVLKFLLILWFVFNLFMGIVMGVFHQGGVVSAQNYIGKNLVNGDNTIIWWKTYPPPIWLMGRPNGTVNSIEPEGVKNYLDSDIYSSNYESQVVSVIDLMGSDPEILQSTINKVKKVSGKSTNLRRSFLVTPVASFDNDSILKNIESNPSSQREHSYRLVRTWSTKYHLSLESIDLSNVSTLKPGLAIWEIQSL